MILHTLDLKKILVYHVQHPLLFHSLPVQSRIYSVYIPIIHTLCYSEYPRLLYIFLQQQHIRIVVLSLSPNYVLPSPHPHSIPLTLCSRLLYTASIPPLLLRLLPPLLFLSLYSIRAIPTINFHFRSSIGNIGEKFSRGHK